MRGRTPDQGEVHKKKPTNTEPNQEPEDCQKNPAVIGCQRQDASRDRKIQYGGNEDDTTPDAISQTSPDEGPENRADTGRKQDDCRLPEAELPGSDNKS